MATRSGTGRFLIISAAAHAVGDIRARVATAFDHSPRFGTARRK